MLYTKYLAFINNEVSVYNIAPFKNFTGIS